MRCENEDFEFKNPSLKDLVPKCNKPLKKKFRMHAGYLEGHTCKECKHLDVYGNSRNYYKCELFATCSSATDIRLKDMACRYFE